MPTPSTVSFAAKTLDSVVQFVYFFRLVLFGVLGLVIVMNLIQRLSGKSNPKKPGRRVGGNYGSIQAILASTGDEKRDS